MVVICLGHSWGGAILHKAMLSGVGCAGSIQMCFSQSRSPHPFTLWWWASGKNSNTHLHGCAWLASSAFRGSEKCLCSSIFCHPIKYTALAYGLQFNKLNLHLKHTARPGGTSEKCKLQVKISIRYMANKSVFARSEKLTFGASVDETMPTVAWWFAAHLGSC